MVQFFSNAGVALEIQDNICAVWVSLYHKQRVFNYSKLLFESQTWRSPLDMSWFWHIFSQERVGMGINTVGERGIIITIGEQWQKTVVTSWSLCWCVMWCPRWHSGCLPLSHTTGDETSECHSWCSLSFLIPQVCQIRHMDLLLIKWNVWSALVIYFMILFPRVFFRFMSKQEMGNGIFPWCILNPKPGVILFIFILPL